jgi:hypothetical protein
MVLNSDGAEANFCAIGEEAGAGDKSVCCKARGGMHARYSLVLMLLVFHSAATLTSLKGKGTMRDTWT